MISEQQRLERLTAMLAAATIDDLRWYHGKLTLRAATVVLCRASEYEVEAARAHLAIVTAELERRKAVNR